jgi:hypothetical protein
LDFYGCLCFFSLVFDGFSTSCGEANWSPRHHSALSRIDHPPARLLSLNEIFQKHSERYVQ